MNNDTNTFLNQYDRVVVLYNRVEFLDKQSDEVKERDKQFYIDSHAELEEAVFELDRFYDENEYGIDKRKVRDQIKNNEFALSDLLPTVYDEIVPSRFGGKKIKNKKKTRKCKIRKSRKTRSKYTMTKKHKKKHTKKTKR